jgi:diguanylate cyclase (GGDEF)-like protein
MNQRTATLLLVDDDAMNRDALSRRLERSGYRVIVAENGAQALEIVSAQPVDLVLLDVMMPVMSGIETLRHLRARRSIAELPVIMVTAKDASRDMVEALELGANDYVTKPVDYAVAQARIRTQLSARREDPLTGLANRVLFMDRLEAVFTRPASGGPAGFAVLFIDVDRFKVINDSLGHLAGDELLIELTRRLQHSLRATDTVTRHATSYTLARLGGDEFTILLDGVKTVHDAQSVAGRLLAAAKQPFLLQAREVAISISIGIVMSAERYDRPEEMLRDADTAMYRAKALGKGRSEIFETSMRDAAETRLQIESDLRQAIERQEFYLQYQPIVTLAGGRLCGFEALLRWQHPTQGLISPDEFVSIAEETGLIVSIGRWVLHEACRQMRAWDHEFPGCDSLTINVNLSVRQCLHPDLFDDVRGVLRDTGLSAERLKLEITESLMLEGTDHVVNVLNSLRALGVQLGLDDFGMGYSGLSYLQRFPFQTIKIDRSFVRDMQETSNVEIVRAIVSLASGLEMNVTAEGVETSEQAATLAELACQTGQGYYFHRPLSSQQARAVLRDHHWPIVDLAIA